MSLIKNLTGNGMNLWRAVEIMYNYKNNGKQVTPQVVEAYHICAQLGASYHLMKTLIGEELAKEIVNLYPAIKHLKNRKTLE